MTPQDFERLSTYIDHQLSPSDRAQLETRLAREPELKAALLELRGTVRALRSLPTLKPPRNFTLTRAQVQAQARPRFQLLPALRLATALAGFAFTVVLSSDLLGLPYGSGGAAAPAPAAESVQKATAITETVVTEADASTLASGGSLADATPAPPTVNQFAVTATATFEIFAASAITPEASADSADSTDSARSALPAPTETPQPLGYDTLAQANSTTTEAQDAAMTDEAPTSWPTIRYVEIGLGLLTLLLALGLWLWRKA